MRAHAREIRRPSTSAALFLSALWPGLGQWYLGQPRVAAWLAAIPLVVLIPALLAAGKGMDGLIAHFVVPVNAAMMALFVGCSLTTRIISLLLVRRNVGPASAATHRSFFVWLLVVTVVVHLVLGYASLGLFGVTSRVFGGTIVDRGAEVSPGATAPAVPLPSVVEPPEHGQRFSVLLLGSDFGTGYTHSLTDTMMVVSIDPSDASVVMASLPRDIARFELYSGGQYDDKLNSLMSRAAADPDAFPDGGVGTLARQIAFLIGVPVDYVAYVDMAAFQDLIDAVGGVDVTVTKAIDDDFYQFPDGPKGFHLAVGTHHLDGAHAIAFVRSRYGTGDNDFTRARRQQELLIALRSKLLDPATLPRLPGLLEQLSHLVSTNFPAERVGELIDLSRQVRPEAIQRFVLGPPYAVQPPGGGTYVLVPDMDRIARWSVEQFGQASRYAPG